MVECSVLIQVAKSVGASDALSSAPLGLLFLGMSLISLTSTHWVFRLWGRKIGFWYGIVVALIGVTLACIGCSKSSIPIVLSSYLFIGAGLGMGMYLRFAALEVVPPEYNAKVNDKWHYMRYDRNAFYFLY